MTPGDRYDPLVLADRVIVPLGPDAAVANAETVLGGVPGGGRFSSHFRYAAEHVPPHRTAHWQVAHIQVTRIEAQLVDPPGWPRLMCSPWCGSVAQSVRASDF